MGVPSLFPDKSLLCPFLSGAINVCPNFLASDAAANLLGVVLHEMIHILVREEDRGGKTTRSEGERRKSTCINTREGTCAGAN